MRIRPTEAIHFVALLLLTVLTVIFWKNLEDPRGMLLAYGALAWYDRIALIQHGRLLGVDTPAGIRRSFDHPLLAVRAAERYRALLVLREYPHVESVYPFGEALHYADARTDVAPEQIARDLRAWLASRGFGDADVAPTAATVEDSFMARMGAPEEVG